MNRVTRRIRGAGFIAAAVIVVSITDGATSAQPDKAADREAKEAQRLNQKIVQLYRAGNYKQAIPLARRVLAISEKLHGKKHSNVATSLNNLALLYQTKGDYAGAEPLLRRALAIYESNLGHNHPDVANSLNNLASLYVDKGNYARAEPLFRRALAIWENKLGKDHPKVATSLNNLAFLYHNKGDYARAEPLYQRALDIKKNQLGKDHPGVATSLDNLASLVHAKGDYVRAEPLYRRALAIRKNKFGEDHPDVAGSLNNLASLLQDKGDYARAEPLYRRALAIDERTLGKDHPRVATRLNNLAVLYKDKGDYARAEPLVRRALAIRKSKFGKDHPDVAVSLSHLATLYRDKRDYASAEPLYRRALAIEEEKLGKYHPRVATSLNNLALLDWAKGDFARAVELLARAVVIDDRRLGLYLSTGSEAQKRAYMNLLTGQTHRVVSLQARVTRTPSVGRGPRANGLMRQARRLAVTTILRRKGRVLDDTAANLAALRRHASPRVKALIERLSWKRAVLAKLVFGGAGRNPDGYRGRVRAARVAVQRLEEALAKHSAAFASERRPVTIERIQSALPIGAALVEFAWYRPFVAAGPPAKRWGKARYVAYVVGRQGEPRSVDLGEAAAVDRVISQARAAFADPRIDPRAAGRRLYQKVMKPLVPLLGDARRVIVSPDGALSLVPLGAAIDDNWRYVLQTRSLRYVTSGRELLRAATKRKAAGRAVIVAAPAFDAAEAKTATTRGMRSGDLSKVRFAALPGTRTEARHLGRMLNGATLLTGATATEGAVKNLAGPRILHLATHGFFLTDQQRSRAGSRGMVAVGRRRTPQIYREDPLLRSGLAFAGANQKRSGQDDGILTAEEAKSLDLHGTRLVVLSACDTGVGQVENGQGVYGLRRALVLAGAETLVMSLWKVDDAATQKLMVAYYKRLLAGDGRAEAMRQVQLAMLRNKATAHPAYWAGFIVSGDARTMDGKPAPLPRVKRSPRGCACDAGEPGGSAAGWWVLLLACVIALARRRGAAQGTGA